MEWQPIETAPKDGSLILLHPSRCWCEDAYPVDAEVGYWDTDVSAWESASAWKAEDYTGPTHWMAIPALPKEQETP